MLVRHCAELEHKASAKHGRRVSREKTKWGNEIILSCGDGCQSAKLEFKERDLCIEKQQ